jgi:hypothetical protein
MRAPHQLLIQTAARLAADGHVDLSADIRQLANKWTPESEKALISGTEPFDLEQTDDQAN